MDKVSRMLIIICLAAFGFIACVAVYNSSTVQEDYYAVGFMNWQNEGCYQARAPALYVSVTQFTGNVNSQYFTLEQVKTLDFNNVPVGEGSHIYSDVFNTSTRDDIDNGEIIVCKFEFYPPAHRYTVTEIQTLESVQNGSVWA